MLIAYQGVAGAFGEEALVAHFGESIERRALPTFGAVFAAVANGTADVGVVPIENSLAGSVLETYDLLLEHALQVTGEVELAIHHCLLAPVGVALAEVVRAHSHPQALAQCAAFLAEHAIEPVAAANTAIAARDVAASGTPTDAAIASERAGTLHGLRVLARDIAGRDDNTTRFFVISRPGPVDDPTDKASLAFATRNEPGALLACLEVFAAHDLNLVKLESRPSGEALWQYTFYADLEAATRGPLDAPTLDAVVSALADRTAHLRVFGRYPRAR